MSNYLRKLGVFHTPPPLCVLESATLTGYVINREFFFRPVFTTPPDKDHKTICDKKVD